LTHLIESGQRAPRLDRSYRLEQAADAVRLLERGEIRGKVAVTV
jgi:NADPH:quinone reductase-like Zn-dependent oxidoreductase